MEKAKVIYWIPRVFCIIAILFVSLFALDSFDPKLTVWQQIAGFLIHMIPSFILTLFLVIAWKWELIGGILLAAVGIIFTPFIFTHNYNMNHSVGMSLLIVLMLNIPFIFVGGFFIYSHLIRKSHDRARA